MILTVITVLAVAGGALAFKAQKFQGAYICQTNEAACTATQKYKIVTSGMSTTLFCDNGNGNGQCNNNLRVTTSD